MNSLTKRVKVFGYIWWAKAMRPIERRSPRTKDRIVKVLARMHVAVYRLRSPSEKTTLAAPTLLLTVPGRTSGARRTSPLFYMPDGDRYVVVGSYGGDHRHPQWYHNAIAAGEGTVEVGSQTFQVTAELASPDERVKLWSRLLTIWPEYDEYEEVAQRQLPVLILTPR
jgi:F420H(2)-dependent quinone reductase